MIGLKSLLHAFGLPGKFMIRVFPLIPATALESIARVVFSNPANRIASANARNLLSITSRVRLRSDIAGEKSCASGSQDKVHFLG